MFFIRRGAHRVEGGKIRLGPEIKVSSVVALAGLEAERSVSTMIRLGLEYVFFNPQAHRTGSGKIRLGPGNIAHLGSGAHRAGGGKVRLADDPSLHNDPSRTRICF